MAMSVGGMQQTTSVMPLVAGPSCRTRASSPCPSAGDVLHGVSAKIPALTLHVGYLYGGHPRDRDVQHARPSRESIEPRRAHQGLDSPKSGDCKFQA